MSDFNGLVTPTHISTYGRYSLGPWLRMITNAASPAARTWTANFAVYIPLSIPFPYMVSRVFWMNGSTIGSNVDFGIYTLDGAKIYSQGSTAQAGTSVVQYASVSTPFILAPGQYYIAWSCDGTTNRAFASATTVPLGRSMGLLQQASAFVLPATATFAAWDNTGFYPVAGITRTASGF